MIMNLILNGPALCPCYNSVMSWSSKHLQDRNHIVLSLEFLQHHSRSGTSTMIITRYTISQNACSFNKKHAQTFTTIIHVWQGVCVNVFVLVKNSAWSIAEYKYDLYSALEYCPRPRISSTQQTACPAGHELCPLSDASIGITNEYSKKLSVM